MDFYGHKHRHSHGYDTEHRHQHQHARKNWHRAIAREGGGEFSPQHQHDHSGDSGVTATPVAVSSPTIANLQAEVRAKVRDNNAFASSSVTWLRLTEAQWMRQTWPHA